MPKSIKCSICGARSKVLSFGERMKWLRRHRKKKHPEAHKKSVEKSRRTKAMGKGKKKKKRKQKKKKWGSIGSPHSDKRKRHLARIRNKGKKKKSKKKKKK